MPSRSAGRAADRVADPARRQPGARAPASSSALVWAALGVVLLAQVYLLYVHTGSGTELFPFADKAGHLLIFAVSAVLAVLTRTRWALVVVIGHALVSEPLQAWLTTSRAADPWDLVADLLGLAAGTALGLRVRGGGWERR